MQQPERPVEGSVSPETAQIADGHEADIVQGAARRGLESRKVTPGGFGDEQGGQAVPARPHPGGGRDWRRQDLAAGSRDAEPPQLLDQRGARPGGRVGYEECPDSRFAHCLNGFCRAGDGLFPVVEDSIQIEQHTANH